jgi:hypothetical protein
MKTIGSHPGAILFRMSIMVILIAIMILVFLSYIDDARAGLERNAILQTRRVIDSSLALAFSNYAVTGRMDRLNELDGGNPFVFLRELDLHVAGYEGELGHDLTALQAPGWYYLYKRGLVAYKAHFMATDSYFRVRLAYRDSNESGSFEYGIDQFENLSFVEVAKIEH